MAVLLPDSNVTLPSTMTMLSDNASSLLEDEAAAGMVLNGTASNDTCGYRDGYLTFELYRSIAEWTENILQTIVGIAGLLANTMAIPILCSKDMNSIFNRLLVFLAISDNLYIFCSISEGVRRTNLNSAIFNQIHEYAFGYCLYLVHNFVLCACTGIFGI